MGADAFTVKVGSVDGATVTFEVLTGLAAGLDNLCSSRSFALVLLSDALTLAHERLWSEDDVHEADIARLQKKAEAAALTAELAPHGEWFVSEAFMKANVDRFVVESTVVERRNAVGEAELEKRLNALEASFGGALKNSTKAQWEPKLWEGGHNYTLRVVAADPKWTRDLEVGTTFDTAAYDVWQG